ncbi:MAG: cytochrome c oxidase assembly protein [Solirubrobacterales bacterium]|nr:cytochrome c oxidase assembly protein [Solirubrobacterales bacterium]
MSLRALALDWQIDASAAVLLVQLAAVAALYLAAVRRGNGRRPPARRWPRQHTICFLAGLAAAAIDLCSGIGTEADSRLSAHMLEHMILLMIVAPLLAAGAPVRLAFHSLPRAGRRRLARCLHSHTVSVLASPVGSLSLFPAHPHPGRLRADADQRIPARDRAWSLSPDRAGRMGAADRHRPAAPPVRAPRAGPLHDRLHAPDGPRRGLACQHHWPGVRPLRGRPSERGAARPAPRGHDHVGRRHPGPRYPRTRTRPDSVAATPTTRAPTACRSVTPDTRWGAVSPNRANRGLDFPQASAPGYTEQRDADELTVLQSRRLSQLAGPVLACRDFRSRSSAGWSGSLRLGAAGATKQSSTAGLLSGESI